MKSVINNERRCFLCGSQNDLERHHIFGGSNRHLSEEDGMWVYLCADCHRNSRSSVHNSVYWNRYLKECGQTAWETLYGTRADFMKRYGKNYLGDEE